MGQAKNRKAEIQALKAAGKLTPFIVRGKIVNGLVEYDTAGLTPAQTRFVEGCVKTINEEMIPQHASAASNDTHLTFVSWIDKEDFIGGLMGPFGAGLTPDSIYAEADMRFRKSQSRFPQVGFTYTRDEIVELGTEQAGRLMDMMAEGATWPWPNARAVFEKRGELLEVVGTM